MKLLSKVYPSTTPITIDLVSYLTKVGKQQSDINDAQVTITRESVDLDPLFDKNLTSGVSLASSELTVTFTDADYDKIYEGEPYFLNVLIQFTGNSYYERAEVEHQKIIFQEAERKGVTTFKTLAQQTMRFLSAGTKTADSKLDQRVVIRELRQVASSIVRDEYKEMKLNEEKMVVERFLVTYTGLDVRFDETREQYYTAIPDNYVHLWSGEGVQQVVPMTGDESVDRAMIPLRPFDMELYRSLPAGSFEDQWAYFIDRNRIWYKDNYPQAKEKRTVADANIKKVMMTIVSLGPQGIKDTDPYPVPMEMERDLITGVLQLYGYTAEESRDLTSNLNPVA